MSGDLTAIVLAGGRSTRFGADKLDAELGGATILDRAIEAVSALASEVLVVGREQRNRPPVPGAAFRAVADPEPFGGPLQALSGALAAATTDLAIVVAGDMPALVREVLGLLVERLRSDASTAAVVLADPRDPSRRQPLPLAIRITPARSAAADALAAGDRSLVRLLDRLPLAELPAESWLPLDPDGSTLTDVDVPGDLDRLRRGARDHRKR